MTRDRPFAQVDVFGAAPYRGNPVAVVLECDDVVDVDRRQVANWTNLSETVFVSAPTVPEADYRLTIMTPTFELPFAGHPTLGAAHAWLAAGGVPQREGVVVQECGIGLVEVRRGEHLAFRAPPLVRQGAVDDATRARALAALRVDPGQVLDVRWVDNGPGWVGVLLASAEAVLALDPGDLDGLLIGVAGARAGDPALEVRAFFPQGPLTMEDPVTGSLNASLAPWLVGAGVVPARYRARQGQRRGRDGVIEVEVDEQDTWVGGSTRTLFRGVAVL
jgi:PhzF family phenazine biosynthesis protein